MYGLGVWEDGGHKYLRSAEIARMIVEKRKGHSDMMRHLMAIERLEARGMSYSNEDFDVLYAAHRFAVPNEHN